ncbi:hypothetical protein [Plantactinospora sonchi]|uniref:Uncharacterized protein n=1 Tax=Plantactinospora sonchi TaxID=1544735 RepID=A0ABU7RP54_9ACTN
MSRASGSALNLVQATPVLGADIAQTATITSMVLVVVLAAVVAFVALGFYRTRRSSDGEERYQALVERSADTEARFAQGAEATVTELRGLRTELHEAREELAEVKQRLAGLERLLSQIG